MIDFFNRHHKVENDFDVIVTAKSLNDHLGYKIPENKVPLYRAGRPKLTKSKAPTASTPPVAQRGTPRTREPPSRATGVEGTRVATRAASPSRGKGTRETHQTRGHDAPIVSDAEVPLFREAGGVVIEMGIPDSPSAPRVDSARGATEGFREEAPGSGGSKGCHPARGLRPEFRLRGPSIHPPWYSTLSQRCWDQAQGRQSSGRQGLQETQCGRGG
jgi:hypothetical protein